MPGLDPELSSAFLTDPDGCFVARGADAERAGHALAALRGEVVQLLALEVAETVRGRGVGAALYDAVRAYARSRGARALEAVAPEGADASGFLLKRRLAPRSLLVTLEGAVPGPEARVPFAPSRLAPGPAFAGWVADLDRETRGFSRGPEWSRWAVEGEVWALKARGRPEAVAALRAAGEVALLGPLAARRAEGAADALPFLAGRAAVLGATRARLVLPAEARALLARALASGFRVAGTAHLFASRARGDLRRYAGSCGPFF